MSSQDPPTKTTEATDARTRAVDAAAAQAARLVPPDAKVGLGTGRAASAFIRELGLLARQGLTVAGVATSEESARLATSLGIRVVTLDEALADGVELDITVDGADEVAPATLDLVKGRGGAMVKERIVAAASRRLVILIDAGKLVRALGERGAVPVEVIPLARGFVTGRLRALGLQTMLRQEVSGGGPFVTENGNLMLDVFLATPIADGAAARAWDTTVRGIAGVVDTGLFLGTAERVLVGHPDGRVDVLLRPGP
jgi:ribose 5-phosphate isomerase A